MNRLRVSRGHARLLLVGALALGACYPGRSYVGPGEVTRSRWPFQKFDVDLDVRSMQPGETRTWRFSGVPPLKSDAGFTLKSRSGLTCPQLKASSLADRSVLLELRDESGTVLAKGSGPLRDWIWSYSGGGETGCNLYAMSLSFEPKEAAVYVLRFQIDGAWPEDAALDSVYFGSYAIYTP